MVNHELLVQEMIGHALRFDAKRYVIELIDDDDTEWGAHMIEKETRDSHGLGIYDTWEDAFQACATHARYRQWKSAR